jgi:propanediol utilization protein
VDAQRLGLADCSAVSVRIDSQGRDLVFNDVTVRIAPEFPARAAPGHGRGQCRRP